MIVIKFVTDNASWFYIVFLVILAALLVLWLRARRSRKQALFGLELEVALNRQRRVMRLMALVVVLAAAVFAIDNLIWPIMPATELAQPTPTVDFFATPPPTFSNVTPTATATVTTTLTMQTLTPAVVATTAGGPVGAQETLTVTVTITQTEEPSPPATIGAICLITNPTEGATVSGSLALVGTADADEFLFYKLEAFGPQTGSTWASLLGDVVYTPVRNGILGQVNLNGWSPGGYSIRVVIVDATSNEIASCYTSINISAP
jgi:hypothetical protein